MYILEKKSEGVEGLGSRDFAPRRVDAPLRLERRSIGVSVLNVY